MVKMLVVDLGGVVIDIDPARCHRCWAGLSGVPANELRSQLFPDPVYEAFERDEVPGADYLEHVRKVLGVDATDEALSHCFNDIYLGVNREVIAMLAEQRDRGLRVVALTNTNRLHHQCWSKVYAEPLSVLEHVYLSFELGARKPEPACFSQVLEQEQVEPREVVFIDDVPQHVAAARQRDIQAVLFTGAAQLVSEFDRLAGLGSS